MAIDINAAQLLVRARQKGVSFGRTATLGRQSLYGRPKTLVSLMRKQGCNITPEQESRLLTPDSRYADEFLRLLGATDIVAIDCSGYEGAQIEHDMNEPIDESLAGQFDVVFDGGTLEHVFNFPVGVANAMRLVRPGGHYIGATPANNFFGHGFYQFSAELYYRIFSPENGFRIESMVAWEESRGSSYYEIPDPTSVRSRIEFVSSEPTYLFVQARKIGTGKIFQAFPQQSDYTAAWSATGEGAKPQDVVTPNSLPFRIRAAARKRGLSKVAGALPLARRFHSWAFRIGHLRENVRGYWKAVPGLRVQRFTSREWLN
jgi:SAM-dependent methyltransferase